MSNIAVAREPETRRERVAKWILDTFLHVTYEDDELTVRHTAWNYMVLTIADKLFRSAKKDWRIKLYPYYEGATDDPDSPIWMLYLYDYGELK